MEVHRNTAGTTRTGGRQYVRGLCCPKLLYLLLQYERDESSTVVPCYYGIKFYVSLQQQQQQQYECASVYTW